MESGRKFLTGVGFGKICEDNRLRGRLCCNNRGTKRIYLRTQDQRGSGENYQELTFSADKTVSVYFQKMRKIGSKGNPNTDSRMTFLGKAIKMAPSATYLGVMIDSKLSEWHIVCT